MIVVRSPPTYKAVQISYQYPWMEHGASAGLEIVSPYSTSSTIKPASMSSTFITRQVFHSLKFKHLEAKEKCLHECRAPRFDMNKSARDTYFLSTNSSPQSSFKKSPKFSISTKSSVEYLLMAASSSTDDCELLGDFSWRTFRKEVDEILQLRLPHSALFSFVGDRVSLIRLQSC